MADVLLTALGGALVQTLTPIPAIEASATQATSRLTALTSEVQTDYQRAKASLPFLLVAAAAWWAWRYFRRPRAQRPRHHRRIHRPRARRAFA